MSGSQGASPLGGVEGRSPRLAPLRALQRFALHFQFQPLFFGGGHGGLGGFQSFVGLGELGRLGAVEVGVGEQAVQAGDVFFQRRKAGK